MATVKCYADESVTLARSNEDNLKVSPNFLPGETCLIFEQEQARKLYTEIGKMIAELWPEDEVAKPDSLSIEDEEEDEITVGLEIRDGSLVVEVGISDSDENDTYYVWLTEGQTEELIASLEAHKKYAAQENAKPKIEPALDYSCLGAYPYVLTGWPTTHAVFPEGIFGSMEIPNPSKKAPEPKAQTFTITINVKE